MSRAGRRRRRMDEHPRKRLLHNGAQSLSDAELVEILLRNGCPGSTAKELARELLAEYGGLVGLVNVEPSYLKRHGIGEPGSTVAVGRPVAGPPPHRSQACRTIALGSCLRW